jgi:hypothetical protein
VTDPHLMQARRNAAIRELERTEGNHARYGSTISAEQRGRITAAYAAGRFDHVPWVVIERNRLAAESDTDAKGAAA